MNIRFFNNLTTVYLRMNLRTGLYKRVIMMDVNKDRTVSIRKMRSG